jgi:glycosyltransferase involved in cell wall biosynthesis
MDERMARASDRHSRMSNVLHIAYDCTPDAGSEPGVGWTWLNVAARDHQVRVITRADNRSAIEAAPPVPGVEFSYVDLPPSRGPLRPGATWGDTYHVRRWLVDAMRVARTLHATSRFDLAHQVTYTAYWLATPFHELGIPFVFGPATSSGTIPRPLWDALPRAEKAKELLRSRLHASALLRPPWRRMALAPNTTWAPVGPFVEERLRRAGVSAIERAFTPLAFSDEQIARFGAAGPVAEAPPHFVISGRMMPTKGHALAIDAMVEVARRLPDAHLHVIGGGDGEALADAIATRHLGEHVTYHGGLDRNTERKIIASSRAVLMPSLRDGGSTIGLFAMAMGRPVVGVHVGHLPEMLGPDTSLLVPVAEPAAVVRSLTEAMVQIATDGDLAARLGEAGRLRVRECYSWDRAQLDLRRWYERACSRRPS